MTWAMFEVGLTEVTMAFSKGLEVVGGLDSEAVFHSDSKMVLFGAFELEAAMALRREFWPVA